MLFKKNIPVRFTRARKIFHTFHTFPVGNHVHKCDFWCLFLYWILWNPFMESFEILKHDRKFHLKAKGMKFLEP